MIGIIETLKVFSLFSKRNPEAHKGDFGRALLFAGSYGMAGAAAIAAKASIKCGAGLTDVACPETIYPILAPMLPEAVFHPLKDRPDCAELSALLNRSSAAAIGCGMGDTDFTEKILQILLTHSKIPLVIDADGINCLSRNIELLQSKKCPVVLTPHLGEMARLTGLTVEEIRLSRLKTASDFAVNHGVYLVLKGHESMVCFPDGTVFINQTGNAGMATGGSGDMLTGMLLSFLAQGMPADNALIAAVHLHGMAGNIAVKTTSMHCLTPNDMIAVLPEIFLQIEELADMVERG